MCSSGCPTPGRHASWGECLRAKNLNVTPEGRPERQAWDSELALYASARRQGIQPPGTRRAVVERALIKADLEA